MPPASASTLKDPRPSAKARLKTKLKNINTAEGDVTMNEFTRRALLQGGTALAAAGALTGPALFDFARAWAADAPWKAEPGAKLTVMRWKRFVPAEDDAFNAMVAAFKAATGTEMNVFSESFEDVQPKASVAANTGSGLDLAWGLHTLPQLFPT